MSDHVVPRPVLVAGAGKMGREHAKVLLALGCKVSVIDRNAANVASLAADTGINAICADLVAEVDRRGEVPELAVVSVTVAQHLRVCRALMERGCRRILLEKPGALNLAELREIERAAAAKGVDVRIAYNRRKFASVKRAREMIAEDGGPISVRFDFTEVSDRIAKLKNGPEEKANWFFLNSTHVVDLAFFLAGEPQTMDGETRHGLPWHPQGAVFVGHGITVRGAAFAYHANWLGPGRWGVEVVTRNRRLILQPLEELLCQEKVGFDIKPVPIDDALDRRFKPGLYDQMRAFLAGGDSDLKTLADQIQAWRWYERVLSPSGRAARTEPEALLPA